MITIIIVNNFTCIERNNKRKRETKNHDRFFVTSNYVFQNKSIKPHNQMDDLLNVHVVSS